MGRPAISNRKLSPTLTLSECHRTAEHPQGFWLYDDIQRMNLSMGAPTPEAALLEALDYYQRRLIKIEKEYGDLRKKVDTFIDQLRDPEENED